MIIEARLAADVAAIGRIETVQKILEVVCRVTQTRLAAVARVTEERWVACAVLDEIGLGLKPGSQLEINETFCQQVHRTGEPVAFDNVAEDETYRDHAIPKLYGIESYLSVPIYRTDRSFFGTLCALDSRPARLNTPEIQNMFRLFAELIAMHLDAQERLDSSQAALSDAQRTAELREQFIAVLGHDLRNPLASIDASTRVLRITHPDRNTTSVLDLIARSVRRMSGLIDNVLDFARARLGEGIGLHLTEEPLAPAIEQVVGELRAVHPERTIELKLSGALSVRCDRSRVAQLLSNLLGNALTHGALDKPITVEGQLADQVFVLSVVNAGRPIPADRQARLFQPFTRESGSRDGAGLGLGLYIASEIARAHGGELTVRSTADETRFTMRMPAA